MRSLAGTIDLKVTITEGQVLNAIRLYDGTGEEEKGTFILTAWEFLMSAVGMFCTGVRCGKRVGGLTRA